jgi:hypothetical protein
MSKHGFDSVITPIRLVTSATLTQNIAEMVSTKNTQFYPYIKYIVFLATVSGFLGLISFRIKIHDILMAFYGLKVGFQVARAMAFMSIFTIPLVACSFDGAIKRIREYIERQQENALEEKSESEGKGKRRKKTRSKTNKVSDVAPKPAPPGSWSYARVALLVLWVLFFTATAGGAYYIHMGMYDQIEQGIGLTEHKFSLRSTEFLRSIDIKGNMFSFFDLGGFLEWQLYPQKLPFIDGRGGIQFTDHQVVTGALGDIEKVFKKYNITYVVTKAADSSGSILPLIKYLTDSPQWELVFADGLTVIFMKNIPDNAEIISKYKLPKQEITLHIIRELVHYTFLGVNKLYVYSYVGNIYWNNRDYVNALRFFKMAYEINENPQLEKLIHRLETMKRTM